MVKSKSKTAAKKRGRGAVAKATKTSKAPASVTRCPYARAEFYIEGGGGDSGWNGEEMYSGGHPATSTPACGELLQFKFPRKWLDIDAKNFEYYTFCFVLHLKKKNKNKSGADDRVGTRTQVINGDGELVDLVREHFRARLVETSEPVEGTWVGRGDARLGSESRAEEAAAKLEVPDQIPRSVAAARGRRHGARVRAPAGTGRRLGRRRAQYGHLRPAIAPRVFLLGWAMMT